MFLYSVSVFLSVSLSVCVSVCLSVCLSLPLPPLPPLSPKTDHRFTLSYPINCEDCALWTTWSVFYPKKKKKKKKKSWGGRVCLGGCAGGCIKHQRNCSLPILRYLPSFAQFPFVYLLLFFGFDKSILKITKQLPVNRLGQLETT